MAEEDRALQGPPVVIDYEVFLRSRNIDATPDNLEQFEVLWNVFELYTQRSKMYGQAWKRFGALNNLIRAATKLERLVEMFWYDTDGPPLEEKSTDDAWDAINYLVFFLRQAKVNQWRRGS